MINSNIRQLKPKDEVEEKLLNDVEVAVQGGLKRDTLINNGHSFNCDESFERFKKHLNSDLFKKIEEL